MTAPDPRPGEGLRSRGTLPTLFGVVIVDLVGFGIVIPVLPFLVKEFGASAVELGLVVALHPAAQFVFSPIWGRLSDRVGRRPILLATIAGTAASLAWLGLAGSLAAVMGARLLAGVFAANVSVASAYLGDVTEESERTRWMGMLGASFGVGFTLGPLLGAGLALWGLQAPMLFAAGLAVLNFAFAVSRLQEPVRHVHDEVEAGVGRLELLRDPEVRRLCVLNLLFTLAVVQLETIFAWFMADRFGYDVSQVALILVLMAVWMGGIQGGGMKRIAERWSERTLILAGGVLLAGSLGVVPAFGSVAWLLVPLLVAATGRAVLQPSLMSLISMSRSQAQRGAVMGTFQSAASLGRVLGPLLAGGFYALATGGPFFFASLLLVALVVVGLRLPERGDAP